MCPTCCKQHTAMFLSLAHCRQRRTKKKSQRLRDHIWHSDDIVPRRVFETSQFMVNRAFFSFVKKLIKIKLWTRMSNATPNWLIYAAILWFIALAIYGRYLFSKKGNEPEDSVDEGMYEGAAMSRPQCVIHSCIRARDDMLSFSYNHFTRIPVERSIIQQAVDSNPPSYKSQVATAPPPP